MNKFIYAILFVVVVVGFWRCQNPYQEIMKIGGLGMTRGLISKSDEATPGYVLFCPLLSTTTYLINLNGEVVHTWESKYGPSGFVYLKDNGNLVRGGRDPKAPVFAGGGQGGRIQEFSWEGELLWDYKFSNESHLSHHDIALLPNGNILVIAWEAKTPEEAKQAGRKPELIPRAGVWSDMIVELQPLGKSDSKTIWEWHYWDHLIQDYDSTQYNFGKVSEHPELIDINKSEPLPKVKTKEALDELRSKNRASTNSTIDNEGSDLFHTNAINYNVALDQIVISARNRNEILIIDHSTTNQEAKSHTGGRWDKGGDILYRWGNPQNYNRGDSTNQQLRAQHDVRWIPKGYPGEGNLTVFNNIVHSPRGSYSIVLEFTSPIDSKGYTLAANESFGPSEPLWKYIAQDTTSFNGPFISGAHRIANGNTFITEGPKGRYIEVTPTGKVVWEYWTPYAGYSRMPDGTFPQPVGPFVFSTFRATHIGIDHPALKGKTLKPLMPQPEAYDE